MKKVLQIALIVLLGTTFGYAFKPNTPQWHWTVVNKVKTAQTLKVKVTIWGGGIATYYNVYATGTKIVANKSTGESAGSITTSQIIEDSVDLSSLANGTYNFIVEACNDDGCRRSPARVATSGADSGAFEVPGLPTIGDLLSSYSSDFSFKWNMWWGAKGNRIELYIEDKLIATEQLDTYSDSLGSQKGEFSISMADLIAENIGSGVHKMTVKLCYETACKESAFKSLNIVSIAQDDKDHAGKGKNDDADKGTTETQEKRKARIQEKRKQEIAQAVKDAEKAISDAEESIRSGRASVVSAQNSMMNAQQRGVEVPEADVTQQIDDARKAVADAQAAVIQAQLAHQSARQQKINAGAAITSSVAQGYAQAAEGFANKAAESAELAAQAAGRAKTAAEQAGVISVAKSKELIGARLAAEQATADQAAEAARKKIQEAEDKATRGKAKAISDAQTLAAGYLLSATQKIPEVTAYLEFANEKLTQAQTSLSTANMAKDRAKVASDAQSAAEEYFKNAEDLASQIEDKHNLIRDARTSLNTALNAVKKAADDAKKAVDEANAATEEATATTAAAAAKTASDKATEQAAFGLQLKGDIEAYLAEISQLSPQVTAAAQLAEDVKTETEAATEAEKERVKKERAAERARQSKQDAEDAKQGEQGEEGDGSDTTSETPGDISMGAIPITSSTGLLDIRLFKSSGIEGQTWKLKHTNQNTDSVDLYVLGDAVSNPTDPLDSQVAYLNIGFNFSNSRTLGSQDEPFSVVIPTSSTSSTTHVFTVLLCNNDKCSESNPRVTTITKEQEQQNVAITEDAKDKELSATTLDGLKMNRDDWTENEKRYGKSLAALNRGLVLPEAAYVAPSAKSCSNIDSDGKINGKEVLAYFGSWNINNREYYPRDLDGCSLTGVLFAFGYPAPNGRLYVGAGWEAAQLTVSSRAIPGSAKYSDDPKLGYFGIFNQLVQFKKEYPHIKVYLSVGGWSWSEYISPMMKHPESRESFIEDAVELLRTFQFDGINMSWTPQSAEDRENYVSFLTELKDALDDASSSKEPGFLFDSNKEAEAFIYTPKNNKFSLSVTLSPDTASLAQYYDLAQLNTLVDFALYMGYDYTGSWSENIGNQAELYHSDANTKLGEYSNVSAGVRAYTEGEKAVSNPNGFNVSGLDASKIILGVPYYGRGWGKDKSPAPGTYEEGVITYKSLMNSIKNNRGDWNLLWNKTAKASIAVNANPGKEAIWTYDDERTVCEKMNFIKAQNLGGTFALESSSDDGSLEAATVTALNGTVNCDNLYPDSLYDVVADGVPISGSKDDGETNGVTDGGTTPNLPKVNEDGVTGSVTEDGGGVTNAEYVAFAATLGITSDGTTMSKLTDEQYDQLERAVINHRVNAKLKTTRGSLSKLSDTVLSRALSTSSFSEIQGSLSLLNLELDSSDWPANANRILSILPPEKYNYFFPLRNTTTKGDGSSIVKAEGIYSYKNFLNAVSFYPNFCNQAFDAQGSEVSDEDMLVEVCKKSLAGMFANFVQEVGANDATYESSSVQGFDENIELYRQGLFNLNLKSGSKYVATSYDYTQMSQGIFGYNFAEILVDDAEMLSRDGRLAFLSALYFYMTPEYPKPSMHEIDSGSWVPNTADIAAHRISGFGASVMVTSGQCSPSSPESEDASNRFSYYKEFMKEFNSLDEVDNAKDQTCVGMLEFDESSSAAYNAYWDKHSSFNGVCKLVPYKTSYRAFEKGVYKECVKDEFFSEN